MSPITIRVNRKFAAAAGAALMLLPYRCAAGNADHNPPIEREIVRLPWAARPDLAFSEDAGWRLTGGADLTPGNRPDTPPLLAVPAGGSANVSVAVPRGGVFNAGKRFLAAVRVKRESAGASASLAASSGGGSSTGSAASTGDWETVSAMADTGNWLPGRDTDTLSITLACAGEGRAIFGPVQLFEIPSYGIFFRFKVLEPAAGSFVADVSIIRRHRDTSHPDRIRHYFQGGLTGMGGAGGVAAGRYSDWVDLRAHLFGQGTATVGLHIHPADKSPSPIPVRVALELAYYVDDGKEPAAKTRAAGPEIFRNGNATEALPDLLAETIGEALTADAGKPTAHMFYRTERFTSNGVLGFLMPENNVPPDRFLTSLVGLEEDVERRQSWLAGMAAPTAGTSPHRILLGANFFPVDSLVSPEAARQEAELLARIGIRACNAPAFRLARRALYGHDAPVEFHYGRIGDEWGRSPYADDGLQKRLDDKFRSFSAGLTNRAVTYYIELMDEPGNLSAGTEDQPAFREFLKRLGATPASVGADGWDSVTPFGTIPPSAAATPLPEGPARDLTPSNDGSADAATREDPDFDAGREGEKAPAQTGSVTNLPLEQRRLLYFTRLFAAQKTADLLAMATRAVKTHIPNARTLVNFRSGVRQVLTPETADWFAIGRQQAVDVMWNEDWVNTYGWRRDGIQSVSYYTELMRTAARKHDLPVGGFLMAYWDQAERKAWSALAHGSRFIHFWRYGPHYANYLPYSWSNSSNTVMEIARFCRDVARLEPTLTEARREPARVALLYAKSDPVWGRIQTEHRMLFFALLHDQIPVDLITETEIEEDGLLDRYDFLYVADVSVRRATLEAIAAWVSIGGKLWLSGDAATRDEFDEPARVLDVERLPASADGATGQAVRQAGKGLVCVNAFKPGMRYLGTVIREPGKLQYGWDPDRRRHITGFALDNGLERPVETDAPCVEAVLYRHPREDIVMLINYTGDAPVPAVNVTVRCASPVIGAESLRRGKLPIETNGTQVRFSLPLEKGDAVVLRHPEDNADRGRF